MDPSQQASGDAGAERAAGSQSPAQRAGTPAAAAQASPAANVQQGASSPRAAPSPAALNQQGASSPRGAPARSPAMNRSPRPAPQAAASPRANTANSSIANAAAQPASPVVAQAPAASTPAAQSAQAQPVAPQTQTAAPVSSPAPAQTQQQVPATSPQPQTAANAQMSPRAASPRQGAPTGPLPDPPTSPSLGQGDVNMTSVPMSPVTPAGQVMGPPVGVVTPPSRPGSVATIVSNVPQQHVIVMAPPTPLDDHDKPLGAKKKRRRRFWRKRPDDEDEWFDASGEEAEEGWGSLILELLVVLFLLWLPNRLLRVAAPHEMYSLRILPIPDDGNPYRELTRLSVYAGGSYAVIVLLTLCFSIFVAISKHVLTMWAEDKAEEGKSAPIPAAIPAIFVGIRGLGCALAVLMMWKLGTLILFVSPREMARRKLAEKLSADAHAMLLSEQLGARFEHSLSLLFFFGCFLAAWAVFCAWAANSYRRMGVNGRVARANARYAALAALYDASGARSNDQDATQVALADVRFVEDGQTLFPDVALAVSGKERPAAVAAAVFGGLGLAQSGQSESSALTLDALVPLLGDDDAAAVWAVVDAGHKQRVTQENLAALVSDIAAERTRTLSVLSATGDILSTLDAILFGVFLFVGGLVALVAVGGPRGMQIAMGAGAFLLGLSFLLQPTATRIVDALLFVFVEHAFDVCDRVSVEGAETLVVRAIEVFATAFVRTDGALMYAPNSVLRTRALHNRDRDASSADAVVATAPASSVTVGALDDLQRGVAAALSADARDFTGRVDVAVDSVAAGGDATLRVEPHFRRPACAPAVRGGALRQRRAAVRKAFEAAAAPLSATVVYADA